MINEFNNIRKQIKIGFKNGLSFEDGIKGILYCVHSDYEFIDSATPDYVIFGPYGSDIPQGEFIKIGYFCENMVPDMSICDWAFGIPYEEEVNNPRYMRIQWHGFNPDVLIKKDLDVDRIISRKTKFCNFIYGNKVSYRERFYKELSRYKHIDAPGKSMNNMPSIDTVQSDRNLWERKRKFLSEYKFTIAFENYSYPGYNTEKLLDPMMTQSLPIYFGNPNIDKHFNSKSFVNGHGFIHSFGYGLVHVLENNCQHNRLGIIPKNKIFARVTNKLRGVGREFKMLLQTADYGELLEKIIAIDRDDTLYAKYILEPWLHDNTPPSNQHVINRWREIFG